LRSKPSVETSAEGFLVESTVDARLISRTLRLEKRYNLSAMKSPFPGMDPYLEPHWLDVRGTFIAFAKSALNRVLPPDLIARTEERLAVEGADWEDQRSLRPDVRVFQPGTTETDSGGIALEAPYKLVVNLDPLIERFIRIIKPDDERLVTVIELLSPWNKREPGLSDYVQKRLELLDAGVHLVEIDLVRRGDWRALLRPHVCPAEAISTYRMVTRLGGKRAAAFIYPLPLDKPLQPIPIPLRPGDPKISLDLQRLINDVYADSRYGQTLDYSRNCDPSLEGADKEWAKQLLHANND
jgi:hypothetical protein